MFLVLIVVFVCAVAVFCCLLVVRRDVIVEVHPLVGWDKPTPPQQGVTLHYGTSNEVFKRRYLSWVAFTNLVLWGVFLLMLAWTHRDPEALGLASFVNETAPFSNGLTSADIALGGGVIVAAWPIFASVAALSDKRPILER